MKAKTSKLCVQPLPSSDEAECHEEGEVEDLWIDVPSDRLAARKLNATKKMKSETSGLMYLATGKH